MSKEKKKSINELKSETGKDDLPEFCKACGDRIIHKQNRNNKIFCSDNCRVTWWNANLDKVKRRAYYDKVCFYCRRRLLFTEGPVRSFAHAFAMTHGKAKRKSNYLLLKRSLILTCTVGGSK